MNRCSVRFILIASWNFTVFLGMIVTTVGFALFPTTSSEVRLEKIIVSLFCIFIFLFFVGFSTWFSLYITNASKDDLEISETTKLISKKPVGVLEQ